VIVVAKTIHSGNLTFIDLTDSKKVDVHISSNLPTVQIYNVNSTPAICSPDWTSTPLKLTLTAYADSTDITDSLTNDDIVWYRQIGSGDYVEVQKGGVELQISSNELTDEAIGRSAGVISYICQIAYNNKKFENKATFARTDTGRDGTSVNILGKYNTLDELQAAHPVGNAGDAYVINGHLYAWTADDLMWEDVGNIQGPKGEDAKGIAITGTSQVFKVGASTTTPTIIAVTAKAINFTDDVVWSYRTNNDTNFTTTVPDGVTVVDNKNLTIAGKNLDDTVTFITCKATYGEIEDVFTVYKAIDGEKGDAASMAFLTNENVSFSANANGEIPFTSASTFKTYVVAYNGTTKTTPIIGAIGDLPSGVTAIPNKGTAYSNTIPTAGNLTVADLYTSATLATKIDKTKLVNGDSFVVGNYLYIYNSTNYNFKCQTIIDPTDNIEKPSIYVVGNQILITFTIANKATLGSNASNYGEIAIPVISPVDTSLILSWSKINSGAKGDKGDKGVDSYTVLLTNESHIFAGDVSNAIEGTAETQILAYKGSVPQSVRIDSIDGVTAGIIDTNTTIPGLKFVCDKLSSDANGSPKITFKCTTAFKDANGIIPIKLTVDGIQFEKIFTYSIAFKGGIGVQGPQGIAGKSMVGVKEHYLASASATGVATTTSGWTETMQTVTSDKKYLWNYEDIMYNDGTTSTINPVIIGVYGDTGPSGKGVSSIIEEYYQSTSATSQSDGTWSTTPPTWANGKYIWTRSIIKYTDNTTFTTSPVCITGQQGAIGGTGIGVDSVDVWYYQSTSATALSGGSWSTKSPTWADGKYIWTKTITTYTNSTTDETAAVCITGQKGATGVGIKSVTEYYLATSLASGVTTSTSGWTSTVQTTTSTNKYLWNYEVITYTDNSINTLNPVIIGVYGDTGSTGKGISGVKEYYLATTLASGVTTTTSGWTPEMQSVTSTKKYLWNYEVITYTDNTTSTVAPILIGVYGDTGAPATSYWLVSSASAVQKTSTGTITVTPSTLTFTGKSKTGTSSPVDYACRWIIAYSTDGANYTNMYTSTANEVSKSITVATTYKTIRARMYMAGGTTTLIDEQIIPVVSDGATGKQGVGIKSTTVAYGTSDSASTRPADTAWQATIPVVTDGKYLWTRTIIDYTDDTIADTVTYTYAKQGSQGGIGPQGTSVAVSSIQYQAGTSATTAPTGTWSNSVVTVAEGSYLWTKTTFSDGKVAYGVAKQGAKGSAGTPAVTFQIYSQNGYLLTIDNPSLTLQTVAYEGSAAITSGATFKWYSLTDGAWTAISGATSNSLSVSKTDVLKSKSYKCEMTYKNNVYTSTATVEDKTDIYSSLIHATSKYSSTNRLYWVLYSIVYSEEGERDELLGPIDTAAPPSPTAGEYWYKIDETNYTVSLMKYSGTAWTTTTDKQELVYDWFLLNDVDNMITLGAQSKVKIVTANDFSRTGSVQCNVSDAELILLTQNNQILTDPSDPIISSIEPTNPINGQLWIKTNSNGSYVLLVWDSSIGQWVVSEADTQNKVYVTKPTQYKTGDLWIVDSNYQPVAYDNGVAQTYKHPEKTMLRATATSQKYSDAHWVEALKYQKELDDVVEDVGKFKKFMTIDDTGLIMQAKDVNGVVSDFKTVLTNTELGFYQGASRVAYINNNQLNISKAEITNGMTISGTTPELKIGNFVLIQESNGSLSIGLKS
jgi:hypothetical protein